MTPKESCEIEIARFYKKYYTFTSSSDTDDLNNLLNSLCSSIEKYEIATGINISKDNKRFLSLKTLRNFSLHHSELLNSSKGIKPSDIANIRTEVGILCLLPVNVIERIIQNTRQEQTKRYLRETFIFYDNYVDIYPAIFNFAVDIYFLVQEASLTITGEHYQEMVNSINYEIKNHHSHYITGKIITLTGISVSDYINEHVISMEQKIEEEKKFKPNSIRLAKLSSSPSKQFKTLSDIDRKFIYDDLISTKAIELSSSRSQNHFKSNRPLTPIERLVVHFYLSRK
jgi:hypothetical protein